MFLATTAIQEFWDTSKDLFFLGSWCFTADFPASKLPGHQHVMPCPWDDRDRFYRAVSYVDSCSELLLNQLTEYLNNVHGTRHSVRYWRIILGPWLILYTGVVYDRFVLLQTALDKYPNLETTLIDESSYRTPSEYSEAAAFALCDAYNLQIFSQLLRLMHFSFPAKPYSGPFRRSTSRPSTKHWVLSSAEKAVRLPVQSRTQITIRKTHLSVVNGWRLAWATRFRALPLEFSFTRQFPTSLPLSGEARAGLGKLDSGDSFQRILAALLPSHLPALYLEGYRAADAQIANLKRPRVIVSGYGWNGDEEMKFYAAREMEAGSRLVAVQHGGGGYGAYRSSPHELHERRLSDLFLAWGWADREERDCANVVNPTFAKVAHPSERTQPRAEILFIAGSTERYLYRFHSCPVGSQWDDYYSWEYQFLSGLPKKFQRLMTFRPYPTDYGHRGPSWIRSSFPAISWDDSRRPVRERFSGMRIAVIDHLSTAFLEALSANIPTILFWDPNRWELRETAQPYFDALQRVGILWHSPVEAAEKLMNVYDDPQRWWSAPDLQTARLEFVTNQALTRPDWIRSWVHHLDRMV